MQVMFLTLYKRGKNDLWRYIITVLGVMIAYLFIGQIPLTLVLIQKTTEKNGGNFDMGGLAEVAETMDFASVGISLNYTLVLILLTFLTAFIALWIFVKFLHKRPFKTLITAAPSLNWGKIIFAFSIWMLMSMGIELVSYFLNPGNYTFNFDPSQFWILLAIAFTLLIVQTSFEELFMRGYLMQGIASASSMRWIPLVLTSVFFGALHLANPEVGKFGVYTMMTYYIGTGLFLGIITLMDDALELALGIHAATNIFSAVFVTFNDSALQTPALFKMAEVNVNIMLILFFAAAVIFTIICAKKYGWDDWSKCYGPVEQEEVA